MSRSPVEYLSNPAPPSVPKGYNERYRITPESDPQEAFRHYAIIDTRTNRKLKGGVMVRKDGTTTTYRDGEHVPGVDLRWLLTQQG